MLKNCRGDDRLQVKLRTVLWKIYFLCKGAVASLIAPATANEHCVPFVTQAIPTYLITNNRSDETELLPATGP